MMLVAPAPQPRRRARPKPTWPFSLFGLPTSRPYAIEPNPEIVTCLQRKCANTVSIRRQPYWASDRALRRSGRAASRPVAA